MFRRNKDGNNDNPGKSVRYRVFTEEEYRDPENAEIYLHYALSWWQKGKYENSWIEIINAERLLYPGSIPIEYGQQTCVDNKKLQTAISLAVNFTCLGLFSNRKKNANKALSQYSSAIAARDDYTPALNNRGCLYFKHDNYSNALDDFDKAIDRSPQIAYLFSNRAVTYLAMHRLDEAMADINKAIEMKDNEGLFYNNRALIYQLRKQHRQAIEEFTSAIMFNRELKIAYLSRALSWYLSGEMDDARYDLLTFQNMSGYQDPERLLKTVAENPIDSFIVVSSLKNNIVNLTDLNPVPETYTLQSTKISATGFAGFNRDILNPQHPENQKVLSFLKNLGTAKPERSVSPRFSRTWGVHPDNVLSHFWRKNSLRLIPASCKWIIYGYAALINPSNGIIFGIGYGQKSSYIRLPAKYHLDSDDTAKNLGNDWTPIPFNGDIATGFLTAYEYVGKF